MLNDFFSSVFTQESVTSDVPEVNIRFQGGVSDILEDTVINDDIIIKKLLSLKINKSPDNDELVPKLPIELAPLLASPLCKIYTKSLNKGIVPTRWKEANISAIFKKGSKQCAGNYRPVNLTSHVFLNQLCGIP